MPVLPEGTETVAGVATAGGIGLAWLVRFLVSTRRESNAAGAESDLFRSYREALAKLDERVARLEADVAHWRERALIAEGKVRELQREVEALLGAAALGGAKGHGS